MRTYCIANKSGRFALLVNQEVVCFISFYIILWVIILLFFAKYLSLHRDIQPFAEYAVTPCMGVWIETLELGDYCKKIPSHPVWVCGLKLDVFGRFITLNESHPVWVCGLKLAEIVVTVARVPLHPVWVCGLKHEDEWFFRFLNLSHPVWVCGLKRKQPRRP